MAAVEDRVAAPAGPSPAASAGGEIVVTNPAPGQEIGRVRDTTAA